MSGSTTGRLVSRTHFIRILEITVTGVALKGPRWRMLMYSYLSIWTQRPIIWIGRINFRYIMFIDIGRVACQSRGRLL